jgi:hypothetical protein
MHGGHQVQIDADEQRPRGLAQTMLDDAAAAACSQQNEEQPLMNLTHCEPAARA